MQQAERDRVEAVCFLVFFLWALLVSRESSILACLLAFIHSVIQSLSLSFLSLFRCFVLSFFQGGCFPDACSRCVARRNTILACCNDRAIEGERVFGSFVDVESTIRKSARSPAFSLTQEWTVKTEAFKFRDFLQTPTDCAQAFQLDGQVGTHQPS